MFGLRVPSLLGATPPWSCSTSCHTSAPFGRYDNSVAGGRLVCTPYYLAHSHINFTFCVVDVYHVSSGIVLYAFIMLFIISTLYVIVLWFLCILIIRISFVFSFCCFCNAYIVLRHGFGICLSPSSDHRQVPSTCISLSLYIYISLSIYIYIYVYIYIYIYIYIEVWGL